MSEFTVDKENLEVRDTRLFNASPERLFAAYTNPEQIAQWWGPRKYKTVVEGMDVTVGGTWRYVHIDNEGTEHAFHGVYQKIDEPYLLVYTFEYEPYPGHVLVETVRFEEQDGKCLVSTVSKYANIEDLEGMVSMGMEDGARESQERLAKLVEA